MSHMRSVGVISQTWRRTNARSRGLTVIKHVVRKADGTNLTRLGYVGRNDGTTSLADDIAETLIVTKNRMAAATTAMRDDDAVWVQVQRIDGSWATAMRTPWRALANMGMVLIGLQAVMHAYVVAELARTRAGAQDWQTPGGSPRTGPAPTGGGGRGTSGIWRPSGSGATDTTDATDAAARLLQLI